MALKRHHKIIIGSASTIVFAFMIATGVLLYLMYVQQDLNYNRLDDKIMENTQNTQSQINILTESLMGTQESLSETQTDLEKSQQELDLLKASAGDDFSGIIENALPGVVTILTDISQGTGFIIHGEGYVVTNAHVMQDATAATVITSDGKHHMVASIGSNNLMDIALLKIEGDYSKLNLGNSENVVVGENVIAIGNPLGLQFSVTEGIISGIHREGVSGMDIYLQTDAALNPGNSGGPLINKQGEVIGINNFKIGEGESLGFALESNYLKNTINEIALPELNQTLIN
jgi:S1-C subfamily serine protease